MEYYEINNRYLDEPYAKDARFKNFIHYMLLAIWYYMINEQYTYSDITAKILGCSFEVHKILGNGLSLQSKINHLNEWY